MPNSPAPGKRNRNTVWDDTLWEAFGRTCADRGVSRNARLVELAQGDVDAAKEES